jgi:hypothetical protein
VMLCIQYISSSPSTVYKFTTLTDNLLIILFYDLINCLKVSDW